MKTKKGIIKKLKLQKKVRVRAKTKTKKQFKTEKEENLKAKKKTQVITKEKTSKTKARSKTQLVKQMEPKSRIKSQTVEQVVSEHKSMPRKFMQKSALEEQVSAENGVADIETSFFQNKRKYMDKEQRAHFRKILFNWKDKLIGNANCTQYKVQEEDNGYFDSLNFGKGYELDVKLRKHNRKKSLLKKIEEALIHIDNNSYGYCCDCGTRIGSSRLDVNPIAIQCTDCKPMVEIEG